MNWPELVIMGATVITAAGSAAGFVVKRTGARFDAIETSLMDVRERVARIEGRLTRR